MDAILQYGTQVRCPLCGNQDISQSIKSAIDLDYWLCDQCQLIFTDRNDLPEPDCEKERYLTHQNGIQYPDYVDFLNQAVEPTLQFLKPGMRGLDFGCGHTPTLSILLKQKGFDCDEYDPFFFPNIPNGSYDFVFVTEAVEHFFRPGNEFRMIKDLLRVGGLLTIMTEFWKETRQFSDWYYAKDFTHVSFYHINTIRTINLLFGFSQVYSDDHRVVIIKKNK